MTDTSQRNIDGKYVLRLYSNDHNGTEYIRADKYDEVKQAADALVQSVVDFHESTGLSSLGIEEALAAYRKATGDT